MKKLYYLVLIIALAIGCKQNSDYHDDKFLSIELDSLQRKFLRMYQSDQIRYYPVYLALNYLDVELQKVKSVINDRGDIKMELKKFKTIMENTAISSPWLFNGVNQLNEIDYLIGNVPSLDEATIKHHLEMIQYAYWVNSMQVSTKWTHIIDNIEIYQTNSNVDSYGQFSTLLIPVAVNTTHLYEISVGDSISRNRLLGEIKKLETHYDTINKIHFSNYSTSKANYGLNKRVVQLVSIFQDGRADTANFKIEFNSK